MIDPTAREYCHEQDIEPSRIEPAPNGRWPDFIIIGAMKSGTTTLYEYLCRHPRIHVCTPKEPQFFSRAHVYARGVAWYRALFANARDDQRCGEASTCYTRWPYYDGVPARIAAHVPGARMIYLMRHPVERAYSHYRHLMQQRLKWGQEPLISFDRALASINEIIDTSRYMNQIERYLQCFPRGQLLLLTLDDLRADAPRTLATVQRFLGVEPVDLLAHGQVTANRWGDALVRYRLGSMVGKFRHARVISRVVDLLPASLRARTREFVTQSTFTTSLMRLTVAPGETPLESTRTEDPRTIAGAADRTNPTTGGIPRPSPARVVRVALLASRSRRPTKRRAAPPTANTRRRRG